MCNNFVVKEIFVSITSIKMNNNDLNKVYVLVMDILYLHVNTAVFSASNCKRKPRRVQVDY